MSEPMLYDQLIAAVRDAFPDVTTTVDTKQTKYARNVILKHNGKTVAYVNGRHKFRIASPRLDRSVLITHPAQIEVAVEFIRGYVPKEVAAT